MNFNQNPHPGIEDHHYIQNLINSQEKRSQDRTFHLDRVKALEERDEEIKAAKSLVLTDFWCKTCKKDFKSEAVKQIEYDWSANQRIAFYKSKCFKGHWCIRLITDKAKDGFWQRSKLVALDRGNHYEDTIQPHETNFNLVYGKK